LPGMQNASLRILADFNLPMWHECLRKWSLPVWMIWQTTLPVDTLKSTLDQYRKKGHLITWSEPMCIQYYMYGIALVKCRLMPSCALLGNSTRVLPPSFSLSLPLWDPRRESCESQADPCHVALLWPNFATVVFTSPTETFVTKRKRSCWRKRRKERKYKQRLRWWRS
jgi:hypothetical protein